MVVGIGRFTARFDFNSDVVLPVREVHPFGSFLRKDVSILLE